MRVVFDCQALVSERMESVTHGSEPRQNEPHRHAFLLMIWQEQADGPWRASLRPTVGEARQGFATIEHLAAYLLRLTAPEAAMPDPGDGPGPA